MLDTELVAALEALGVPPGDARSLTVEIRDRLHPIAAVAARTLIAGVSGQPPSPAGMSGLGTAATASQGLSVGATAGSVFGPIGTAVGAIVGAIAGYFVNSGQKPQRQATATAALAQLKQLPASYAGRAISVHDMNVLFMALYLADGWLARDWLGTALTNHPSAMGNWTDLIRLAMTNAMKAAADKPVGASVTINTVAGDKSGPYTFANPGLDVTMGYVWAQTVMMPMVSMFAGWHSASAQARAELVADTNALHVLALLYDQLLSTIQPQNASVQLATAPTASVPATLAQEGALLAAEVQQGNYLPGGPIALSSTNLTAQQQLTAQLLQSQVAGAGTNLTSPAAAQLLANVAQTGVQTTPSGPSTFPTWAIPVGFGVVSLMSK